MAGTILVIVGVGVNVTCGVLVGAFRVNRASRVCCAAALVAFNCANCVSSRFGVGVSVGRWVCVIVAEWVAVGVSLGSSASVGMVTTRVADGAQAAAA